jgi:GST-like protein
MYTLYGFKGSGSAAVEIALRAAQVPYRVVQAASWEPSSELEALRRVNPLTQIPTLVLPDGSVMTESAAILIHLGLVAPQGKLLPVDEALRAQCIRGLVFIAANCYSAISIMDFPQRWTTDTGKPSLEAVKAGTHRQLHRHWDIFADLFDRQPYLSGHAPGALDFLAAVVSKWSGTRTHLQAKRPAFFETLQRIDRHELVAPIFALHWDR